HAIQFKRSCAFPLPEPMDKKIDSTRTTFLDQFLRRWGKTGLGFLNGFGARQHRYGLIGLDDWSMHPVLHPGSLVLIDESRRRIATGGWGSRARPPVFFFGARDGCRRGRWS